ncbi:LexA family protein [Planococcus sp. CAU13]|uniref:LexA family protein n=1 Tax=Planococcus sp. CAU13 TaxID=1541197 RepID=UPI00052FE3FD|nr:S24 family peptidase [Planococcus sp. CAU13]
MDISKEELDILSQRPSIVYDHFLKSNLSRNNLSLTEVANLSEEFGQKVTVSYLSKLKNGKLPPPSYKITLILAKIFQRDPEIFLAASLADSDEYNRVELVNALRWAFPEDSEIQIKKRVEDTFLLRFLNIGKSETSLLLEKSISKKYEITGTNDKSEIREVPLLSKIFSKTNIYSNDFIKEWTYIKTSRKKLFYFIMNDDSMKTNRIFKNDRLLIDSEEEIQDGDIALINIDENEGIIRKIKKLTNESYIVYTDNPEVEPVVITKKEIKIRGKVIEILVSL